MKKFLSFLSLACLTIAGAWAQTAVYEVGKPITSKDQLVSGKYYISALSKNQEGLIIGNDYANITTSTAVVGSSCTDAYIWIVEVGTGGKFSLAKSNGTKISTHGASGVGKHNILWADASHPAAAFTLEDNAIVIDGINHWMVYQNEKMAGGDGTSYAYLHCNCDSRGTGENNLRLSYWEGRNADLSTSAVKMAFYPCINWNGLQAALNNATSYTVGEGLGQYSYMVEGVARNDAWATAIEGYQSMLTAHTASSAEVDAAIATVNSMTAALQINQPRSGRFYTFRGSIANDNDFYYAADHSGSDLVRSEKANAAAIFYLDNEGHLISYSTGHYTYCAGNNGAKWQIGTLDTDKTTYSFTQAIAGDGSILKGQYALVTSGKWIQPWHTGDAPNYQASAQIAWNGHSNDNSSGWTLKEVTFLPVEFKAASKDATTGKYYSTLYSPVPLALTAADKIDGLTAYYAAANENDHLIMAEQSTVIPANTPVVLSYRATGTKSLTINSTSTADPTAGNLLRGTVCTKASTEGQSNYVLSIVGGKVSFYKFGGTTLQGFKAYYNPAESGPTISEVQAYLLNFGGTEGINSVMNATNLKAGYDLQGRMLNKGAHGINILNGKKIIK